MCNHWILPISLQWIFVREYINNVHTFLLTLRIACLVLCHVHWRFLFAEDDDMHISWSLCQWAKMNKEKNVQKLMPWLWLRTLHISITIDYHDYWNSINMESFQIPFLSVLYSSDALRYYFVRTFGSSLTFPLFVL